MIGGKATHHLNGREYTSNDLFHFRMAIDVFLNTRLLAVADTIGEFIRELSQALFDTDRLQ